MSEVPRHPQPPHPAKPDAALSKVYDDIARMKPGTTDVSGFTRDLSQYWAHHPGNYQAELKQINEGLHAKGLLPGLEIVGVNGRDLVLKGPGGAGPETSIIYKDSADLSKAAGAPAGPGQKEKIGGRDSTFAEDGSGTVTAKKGDSPWSIARDLLIKQNGGNPKGVSDHDIANYIKELASKNPSLLHGLKPGDEVQVPAASKKGLDSKSDQGDGAEMDKLRTETQTKMQQIKDDVFGTRPDPVMGGSTVFSTAFKMGAITDNYITKHLLDKYLRKAELYSGPDKESLYPPSFVAGLTKLRDMWDSGPVGMAKLGSPGSEQYITWQSFQDGYKKFYS
jgi:hypothetical protein